MPDANESSQRDELQDRELPMLHSKQSILLATFLGSPAAGAILMRRNLINLGRDSDGTVAAFLGIGSSVLLFALLMFLPDTVTDKIPNSVIPLAYTAAMIRWVNGSMGIDLERHEAKGGLFYSKWRGAGVGLVALVVIVGVMFGYGAFWSMSTTREYDSIAAEFDRNEDTISDGLKVLDDDNSEKIVAFFSDTAIPLMQENLEIVDRMDQVAGLNKATKDRHEDLRRYCRIKIRQFKLLQKLNSGTIYIGDVAELKKVEAELDEVLRKLN